MAIFTAEEHASDIKRCWLGERDITCLAVCACIPGVEQVDAPPSTGMLTGEGWVDLYDTNDAGAIVAGDDGEPTTTRHYGVVSLEWKVA